MFPTAVRYTGASLAPYIAIWLAKTYGLPYVGYYLAIAALLTWLALWATPNERAEK